MQLFVGHNSWRYLAWWSIPYYTDRKWVCNSRAILYIWALHDSERKQGVTHMDAIILFGGVFLLVGLPLIIMGLVSGWREKQNEKRA